MCLWYGRPISSKYNALANDLEHIQRTVLLQCVMQLVFDPACS